MEGDNLARAFNMSEAISIHALRVEGDAIMPKYNMLYTQISIHALRVEGDV